MKLERRLRLVEALVEAQVALQKAASIALEEDPVSSEDAPSNVVREATKTGPRTPFVMPSGEPPSRRPTRPDTRYAANSKAIRRHLEDAFRDATTRDAVVEVDRLATSLVERGYVTAEELESIRKGKS